ncbi:MAG: hypothetical protein N2749_07200 [Clostridia bacterium]|nr:hypothetical protein [Clostridia bacterium]
MNNDNLNDLSGNLKNENDTCSRPPIGFGGMHMGPGMIHGNVFPIGGMSPGLWTIPFFAGMYGTQGNYCPYGQNCPYQHNINPNNTYIPMPRYYIDSRYGTL